MRYSIILLWVVLLFWNCGATSDAPKNISKNINKTYYWQQHVNYKMEIDMNVSNFKYQGKQNLVYTNNSPDVLHKVFYHLYFNAFQPGSEMDVRSQTIADPDPRVSNRISKLKPNEVGYIKVKNLSQNGTSLKYHVQGTVLEVNLNTPIQPGESVTFDMNFEGQVPVQIRRSGRDNKEGVALSMTQWFPKMAEYDFEGWHADPYIGREFHGVWGDFDVKITIDKNYILGGTGYLQNPNEIGYGYENAKVNRPSGDKLTWHFKAPNVHDFTWAADPDYVHDTLEMKNGITLHFLYKNNSKIVENWKKLQPKTEQLMQYFSEHIGQYPYKQYSVIQGGDGGMEYGMCTLITGERKLGSLIGVTAHELAHSWFQFLLATNEAKHEWMDEGFTTYISNLAESQLSGKTVQNPNAGLYNGYLYEVNSGDQQPLTTHADRYNKNRAYTISAYVKGALFISQLEYIIGKDNLKNTIKKYFVDWAFKHPTPNDFIRCAEKVSGLELDWYLTDFARTVNTIDYAVKSIDGKKVTLERIGNMPMPIDMEITYTDGSTELFYSALPIMRGEKPTSATQLPDWPWAMPTFEFEASKAVKTVRIDPQNLMADVDRANNEKGL